MNFRFPSMRVRQLNAVLTAIFLGASFNVNAGELLAQSTPIDLQRYAGTWHEIARLPNYFQRNCARDTTANYTRNGEFIRVINRCVKANGEAITAEGRARVVDANTNRKLKVGFFSLFGWWPFEGDYWILDISSDYEWAIVGHPAREYGWILARTPTIDAPTRAHIDRQLRDFGYDPAKFVTGTTR